MRIQFTRDHDHVEPLKTISFSKGDEETVAKEVGEAAVAAGAAKTVEPSKPAPHQKTDG